MKKTLNLGKAMGMMMAMVIILTVFIGLGSITVQAQSNTTKGQMQKIENYVQDSVIVTFDTTFDGILTEDMKKLGITSLEKIFDAEDLLIYKATIDGTTPIQDVVDKMVTLPLVQSAELDYFATTQENDSQVENYVQNSVIITFDTTFDGILTEDMKKLGITSLEKIFDAENLLIYKATIDGTTPIQDVVDKMVTLPLVQSAELDYFATTQENDAQVENYVQDSVIITFDTAFDGILTEDMKKLGITSLEKIFDAEDLLIYKATIDGTTPIQDVVDKIAALPLVQSAELDYVATTQENDAQNILWYALAIGTTLIVAFVFIIGKKKAPK